MAASLIETAPVSRVSRLRGHTSPMHESLDQRIMSFRPFENRMRYGMFLQVQQPFLCQVNDIYNNVELNAFIPGLAERARLDLINQDMADLGLSLDQHSPKVLSYGMPEALGWLYVAEGSNLGAAFLLKEAKKLGLDETFGARHLTGHADGRGLSWRRFIADFDAIVLSKHEEHYATQAAADAFRFVQDRVTLVFG